MSAYLLHVRSGVAFRHIEGALDDFEQRFIPDCHYVVSREGHTANYIVSPDRPLKAFFQFLRDSASNLCLDRLSLIEIGSAHHVLEQGCASPYAEDACGEWRRVRNEESFELEEVRVRTGLDGWLRRHARRGKDVEGRPIGILLYFHHPLEADARWITNFRGALGKSARPHLRDEYSVLLTAEWQGMPPERMFKSKRFRPYFESGLVHTAFCFTIGLNQMHPAGEIQSVLPPFAKELKIASPEDNVARPRLEIVGNQRSSEEMERIKAAVARLKSQPRRA